jgi:ABC-type nitrate/sulfonate/bicarbonate transport system substrate-binding protein
MGNIKIVAGFAGIGQGAGPMILTQSAGIFAQYGLDVETPLVPGAVGVVKALMRGELQFGNLAAPALLRAGLVEGSDVVYLTGGINQQFLMGRPGIADRKQLAGGKITFARDGGVNDLLVHFITEQLQQEGIHNIELTPRQGRDRERISYLLTGECDAGIFSPPLAIEAKRQGCHFLIDFADYGLNFALGGIGARRSYVAQHPEITTKFLKAYVTGMHRYQTDRTFAVQVQQQYSEIADRSVAEETYDITRPGMPRVPYPVTQALTTALRVMAKDLPAAATADGREFVEDRFLREIEQSGFIASLYGAETTR